MKNKNKLLLSMLCVIMSCLAVAGTTFALNAESTEAGGNIVKSAGLNAVLYVSDDLDFTGDLYQSDSDTAIFNGTEWEPGYTQVRYFKVYNDSSIDFSYNFAFSETSGTTIGKLDEVIDIYYKKLDDGAAAYTDRNTFFAEAACAGTLDAVMNGSSHAILPADAKLAAKKECVYAIALKLKDDAPSSYKGTSINNFTVQLVATNQTSNS